MTGVMMWAHVVAGIAAWCLASIIMLSVMWGPFRMRMAVSPNEYVFNAKLTAVFFYALSLDLMIVALSVSWWLHLAAVVFASVAGWLASAVMLGRVVRRWRR